MDVCRDSNRHGVEETYAEGIEPALTLYTAGLPIRGMTYRVIRSVNLRSNYPDESGGSPVRSDSKGAITAGSVVKVDEIKEIKLDRPTARTWVWAHATLIER